MAVTTRAIILGSLKYGDSSLIVKAFTAESGLRSYLLKGVLASRKGKLKVAYFQPLTQVELVANHRNKGSLEFLKEVRIAYPYQSMHLQMNKKAICLFLAEVLAASIREEEKNEDLYYFLETSLQWLDIHEKVANFHLLFLLELLKYLGIYPDTSAAHLPHFDLREGIFTERPPLGPAIGEEGIIFFKALLGIKFDALHTIKLGQRNRNVLLQQLLHYYEIHVHGFRRPRSLAILNEVFG